MTNQVFSSFKHNKFLIKILANVALMHTKTHDANNRLTTFTADT